MGEAEQAKLLKDLLIPLVPGNLSGDLSFDDHSSLEARKVALEVKNCDQWGLDEHLHHTSNFYCRDNVIPSLMSCQGPRL